MTKSFTINADGFELAFRMGTELGIAVTIPDGQGNNLIFTDSLDRTQTVELWRWLRSRLTLEEIYNR